MGLDNGIIIKGKNEFAKSYLEEHFSYLKEYSDAYEFGYWRKCYNIRKRFIDTFNYDYEKGEIRFTIKDIPKIIEVLKYFLNEDNWIMGNAFNNGSCVFGWVEELPSIASAIRDLAFFYNDGYYGDEIELTDEDFEIYFYDSY